MKILNLFLKTKNKESLKSFLFFFKENNHTNFNFLQKKFPKTTFKTIFTILKSPHVNKKAQEQFEIKTFNLQLTIKTTQIFKLLIFLKRLKNNIFSDINFKIKNLINLREHNSIKPLFNNDNFSINSTFQQKKIVNLKKVNKFKISKNTNNFNDTKQFIKLIEFYGKFSFE